MYKLEGIGEDMMVDAMDFNIVDDMFQVSDEAGFSMCRLLARKEGIFGGGSSGAAVWGALQVAKNLAADKNVVTILPDTGFRYLSKVYNDEWMRDNGLIQNDNAALISEITDKNPKTLITTNSQALIKNVIHTMKEKNISQMPVIDEGKLIGIISETAILNYMLSSGSSSANTISQLVQAHFSVVNSDVPVFTVLEILKAGENAVLVLENDRLKNILTKIDLIDYLS